MSAFDTYDLYNVLFLDIETAPAVAEFDELSDEMQELWGLKCRSLLKRQSDQEVEHDEMEYLFKERAGIYSEFGKIICISVGFLTRQPDSSEPILRLKSFSNHVEAALIDDFDDLLNRHFNNPDKFAICGHNIKEFDIPYICRRMVVHQMPFPKLLDLEGKKPWETLHLLDTMEMWKFGDRKNYTSLKVLAALLNFPSPKDDIDGSQVGRVYWDENDVDRISFYCEKDVLATIQLFLRYRRAPILEEDQVSHIR